MDSAIKSDSSFETSIFFWSHWLPHSVECCDETFTCLATKQQQISPTLSALSVPQGCSLQPPKSPVICRLKFMNSCLASIAAGVIESHFLAPLHIVSVLTLLSSTGQAFYLLVASSILVTSFPNYNFSGLLTLSLTSHTQLQTSASLDSSSMNSQLTSHQLSVSLFRGYT